MTWTGKERRRFPRSDVDSLCMAPMAGAVKNLNGHGLGLETWDPLRIHDSFVLTIGQVGLQARLRCRVIWCRLVRTEPTQGDTVVSIYRSGVRFLEMGES